MKSWSLERLGEESAAWDAEGGGELLPDWESPVIGGRRDAGGCEGGHVSVRKRMRIDGAWAIGLEDDETVS